MSYVEVKEFDPGAGNEYMASKYPGPCIYWNQRMVSYFLVFPNGTVFAAMGAGRTMPEIDSMPSVNVSTQAANFFDAEDVARLLAVVVHNNAALVQVQKKLKGGAS